ncbi:MAG: glycosyltransferase [Cyclobacteriaceae bacterium]
MGKELPDFAKVAFMTVSYRCNAEKIIVWCDKISYPSVSEFKLEGLEAQLVDVGFLIEKLSHLSVQEQSKLGEIFEITGTERNIADSDAVRRARGDLIRLLILYHYGGVYLDCDTLVLKDLSPLLNQPGFMGYEKPVWSINSKADFFYKFFKGPALEVLRFLCLQVGFGYRISHSLSSLFPNALNQAVLGFTPCNGDVLLAITTILDMDLSYTKKTLVLGPHLWQKIEPQMISTKIYPFTSFYPLGPRFARHYFRSRTNSARALNTLIRKKETYVPHLCLSSSTRISKQSIEYCLANPGENMYTYAVSEFFESIKELKA